MLNLAELAVLETFLDTPWGSKANQEALAEVIEMVAARKGERENVL